MKPSKDPPLLAVTRVGLTTTHSLGAFFQIYITTAEREERFSRSFMQKKHQL